MARGRRLMIWAPAFAGVSGFWEGETYALSAA